MEQPAMCGNCGGETFKVTLLGSPNAYDSVSLVCLKCFSTSVLVCPQPKVHVGWGLGSQGVVCPKGGR